ncbi:MAG: glycoside hydrolase family 97 N-terminal domain-containing protein, partial [Oceanospirillaceae bacterium]|nr:glycoside hydrolase family 97 N-terminal domain-containing protein [Oceanospirillaceae bacterium]
MTSIGLIILLSLFLISCQDTNQSISLYSPSKSIQLQFNLTDLGEPYYSVDFKNNPLIEKSLLGFEVDDNLNFSSRMKVIEVEENSVRDTWSMVWGENEYVYNNYNEVQILMESLDLSKNKLSVIFRVYDDGVSFRYKFPKTLDNSEVIIVEENTEFNLKKDHEVWWIPADWESYEHLYNHTKLSEIDAIEYGKKASLNASHIPYNAVSTPVTMKTNSGVYLSIHEANLRNYSGMTLQVDTLNLTMKSKLVSSDLLGYSAKVETPFKTPWRTIQIADNSTKLVDSNLIINLNEPNQLADISWFSPMKYVGIWWEM